MTGGGGVLPPTPWNLCMEIQAFAPWNAILKVGTDRINLIIRVLQLMDYFTIQEKVIAYTSDGGYNCKTCRDSLER